MISNSSEVKKLQVACIQINSTDDFDKNLLRLEKFVCQAVQKKADLIAFPENFAWRGGYKGLYKIAHDKTPLLIQHFQTLARKYRVAFLLGSLLEPSTVKGRYFNTSVLISAKGSILARYQKIHLFDVSLKGKVVTKESKSVLPGKQVVTSKVKGIPVGLAICYDLRFPELFRQLSKKGSQIIFVPSNFTEITGKAHWETLLRARAIENQAFIVAPGQVGVHPGNQINSFGNSMIIDPWGRVLAQGSKDREEVVTAVLDLAYQDKLRRYFPVLKHSKLI